MINGKVNNLAWIEVKTDPRQANKIESLTWGQFTCN